MAISDIFSRRQKRLRGEFPDVFQYEVLPETFRVQVIHILIDLYGRGDDFRNHREKAFTLVHDALCREYGVFRLNEHHDNQSRVCEFIGTEQDIEKVLSAIELVFRAGRGYHSTDGPMYNKSSMLPDEAEEELNARFKEHGIGYQFESANIVKMDSQFVHQDVIKPALHLLKAKRFRATNDEFLKAHEHYRHGRHAEAMNECYKAFESTLKVICSTQKWVHNPNDNAKRLLDVVFDNGLIPPELQSTFSGLRAVLESAVPTPRNRMSGHGAGTTPRTIPAHLAAYVLHVTASTILFLTECEKKLL